MKPGHWYIKGSQLFEKLSEAELAGLEAVARVRSFPKGSPIYLPSEPASGLFLLGEGRVQICSLTPDGRKAIIAFIEPGELFGEMVLVGETQREEFAEAVAASTVIWLPTGAVEDLMATSPAMSLGVTKLIGLRRVRVERRLRSLLFRSNRDRLLHVLAELEEQYGRPDKEGILIGLRLSHQDIASIIGSTRESVTLLLGQLQLEGLIRVGRQRIIVRDVTKLRQAMGLSTEGLARGGEKPIPAGQRPHWPAPRGGDR